MSSPSLDEQRCQLLQELQDLSLLEGVSVSPELISFLTERGRGDADAVERSPLQIELILRSLNPSLANPLAKALR